MSRFEINEEFLNDPILKYDAANLVLESIIYNIPKNTEDDYGQCKNLIEGDISNLISYLKEIFQNQSEKTLSKDPIYQTMFGVIYYLQEKGLLGEEEINKLSRLIGISEIHVSKRGIIKIRDRIKFFTNFYLTEGNNDKGIIQDKAVFYYCISNYNKAITLQEQVINFYNGDYSDYALLGDFYSADGKHTEAIKYYFKASYWHPDNKRQYDLEKGIYCHLGINKYPLKIGNAYYNIGKYNNALISFLKCEDASKVGINTFWNLGGKLCEEGEFNIAIKAFEKIIELNPTHYNGIAYLGLCYYQLGNYDEAIIYFKEALTLDENNENAYKNLYTIYCEIGDYISAKKILEKLVNQFPNKEEHKNQLAVITKEIENQKSIKKLSRHGKPNVIGEIGGKQIEGFFG